MDRQDSKMFDFISGKKRGKIAELEASLEHTAGYLGVEISENEKMRAAISNYLSVFDRCGGMETVSAAEFANARQQLRDAIA